MYPLNFISNRQVELLTKFMIQDKVLYDTRFFNLFYFCFKKGGGRNKEDSFNFLVTKMSRRLRYGLNPPGPERSLQLEAP